MGQGVFSCAKFAATNPEDMDNIFFVWAMGYMSGINATSTEAFADLNTKKPAEMKNFLRQYCNAHPLTFRAPPQGSARAR